MRIPLFKRFIIALLNVVFPPLSVYLLCGLGHDLFINCVLFLLAVIPSHVHGFYISLTYFNRKRKVRKGVYPGGKKSLIRSDRVIQGGADKREYARLKAERDANKLSRRVTRTLTGSGGSSPVDGRVRDWDDGWKEYGSRSASLSRTSSRWSARGVPVRTSTRARRRDGYDDEGDDHSYY